MTEVWVYVVGYVGFYQVSSLGNDRRVQYGNPKPRNLKPAATPKGYVFVTLSKNNRQQTRYIHHLVWEAFVGPMPDGEEINHKNGTKADCSLTNLETGTHQYNIQHAIDNGLIKTHGKGEDNAGAKLTKEKVFAIREMRANGATYQQISDTLDVGYSNAHSVATRQTWSHV